MVNADECLAEIMGRMALMMRDPISAVSDRDRLIEHCRDQDQRSGTTTFNFRQTAEVNSPNVSLPIIAISKTNMISIAQILQAGVGSVHEGKYLLCRSIFAINKDGRYDIACGRSEW